MNSGIYTNQKNMVLLYLFIEKYNYQEIQNYPALQRGLKKILKQSKNSVASPLSNGFVEGTNNN